MPRVVVLLVFVCGAVCKTQSLEPDVQLLGASATLAFGAGFGSNSWNELRLRVSDQSAYRLELHAELGPRQARVPLVARIDVAAGVGVRGERLRVPLFGVGRVRLKLLALDAGQQKSVEVLAYTNRRWALGERVGWAGNATELGAQDMPTPLDPALWLGNNTVLLDAQSPTPTSTVLGVLAAGASVEGPSSLARGPLGLGVVGAANVDLRSVDLPNVDLLEVARAVAATPTVPQARSRVLAWWAFGVFAGALLWFALRPHVAVARFGAACLALLAGMAGFWALQPQQTTQQQTRGVVLGSRGWGLRLEVRTRLDLQNTTLVLPPGAMPLLAVAQTHGNTGVSVSPGHWVSVSCLLPPVASRVPVRVRDGKIINQSAQTLQELYVVGLGRQEPLAPRTSRRAVGTGFGESSIGVQNRLAALLPAGSVIAKLEETWLVALVEES